MTKAKLFTTGGSQAVRLPAEFRFEGSEVDIRRDSVTGEVVLSKPTRNNDILPTNTWLRGGFTTGSIHDSARRC